MSQCYIIINVFSFTVEWSKYPVKEMFYIILLSNPDFVIFKQIEIDLVH